MRAATRRTLLSRPAAAAAAGFVPTDLASLTAWYDFSDAATMFVDAGSTPVSSDGDYIWQINDKSISGFNLVREDANSMPTYRTNVFGSLSAGLWAPAVAGQGDGLARNATDVQKGSDEHTIFAVRTTADNTTGQITVDAGLVCVLSIAFAVPIATTNPSWETDTNGGGALTLDELVILTHHFKNTPALELFVNGVTDGPHTAGLYAGVTESTYLRLGHVSVWQSWSNGYFAEVLYFNDALSVTDLNIVGEYLAAKWGVSWTTVT